MGREILELRIDGHAAQALATLRARGVASSDAFAVGSTVALPLIDLSPSEAIAAINETGVAAAGIATRRPTLDDVYLRLTGNQMAEAA